MGFLLLVCSLLAAAALLPAEPRLQIRTASGQVRFGILGDKPAAPAPTVFFLGGAVEDSLTQPQYLEAQEALGAGVLFVTFDLPGHGLEHRQGEPGSIGAWRYRLDHGEDLTGDVVRRGKAVLDFLVNEGYTDPTKVAVFGTSRGGFMALHFAAAEPRIHNIAGFAPVTDLLALAEFAGMSPDQSARRVAGTEIVDRLLDRGIWLIIGSTDHRVGTGKAIRFTERVIEKSEAAGRRPEIELHIGPSDGHRVPAGGYAEAGRWLRRQWNGL